MGSSQACELPVFCVIILCGSVRRFTRYDGAICPEFLHEELCDESSITDYGFVHGIVLYGPC